MWFFNDEKEDSKEYRVEMMRLKLYWKGKMFRGGMCWEQGMGLYKKDVWKLIKRKQGFKRFINQKKG